MSAAHAPSMHGEVAPGWSRVADAFQGNLQEANELGAAVCVYADGLPVVDLWGGTADARTGTPWQEDTAVCVFSSTKGVTALCAHLLVERGLLDLDAPVARYWPAFAQAGKESIPVRWLLTHQCGLPFVDDDLTLEDLLAHEPVVRALEEQTPLWEPGSHVAYHAVTFGHLVGEVVRRITGRTLGTFFAEEVAGPLGLGSWLGLDVEAPVALARMERTEAPALPGELAELLGSDVIERFVRSITLGLALSFPLVTGEPGDFNDRRVLAVELGGSNLVTDARSLARLYGAGVREVDGSRLLSEETVQRMSAVQTRDVPRFGVPESLAHLVTPGFALGFQEMAQPLSATSFGHGGAGGSLGFGDLEHGIGFAYVMNRMEAVAPDTRATSLVDAVRACL
jgi:CubicO group peptidase (beta-lactamase class C family)